MHNWVVYISNVYTIVCLKYCPQFFYTITFWKNIRHHFWRNMNCKCKVGNSYQKVLCKKIFQKTEFIIHFSLLNSKISGHKICQEKLGPKNSKLYDGLERALKMLVQLIWFLLDKKSKGLLIRYTKWMRHLN